MHVAMDSEKNANTQLLIDQYRIALAVIDAGRIVCVQRYM